MHNPLSRRAAGALVTLAALLVALPPALAQQRDPSPEGSAASGSGGAGDRVEGRRPPLRFDGEGGASEALLRQTEATCGRPYQGSRDQLEHSRFHCMYAYFLQCNNLSDQQRVVCAQYATMQANGAPPCPHCPPAPPAPAPAPATGRPPTPTCAGQATGTACWMALANQADCYVWNGWLQKDESVTWSGACSRGFAHGEGSLRWVHGEDKKVLTGTGLLQAGKRHGPWVERWADGRVSEGPYVAGKRHGPWVERLANGDVWEGPYVAGKRHGPWVWRWPEGDVWEGPLVDGKMHGHWVLRLSNGGVEEGPYVDGKKHGHWVTRWPEGDVSEGPYVAGKRHGHWVIRWPDGRVSETRWLNGEPQR